MRKPVIFAALGVLSAVGVVIAQRLNDGGPPEVVRDYLQGLQDGSVTPGRYVPRISRIISVEAQPVPVAARDQRRGSHRVEYKVETFVTEEYSKTRLRWLEQQLVQEGRVLRNKPKILARTRKSLRGSMDRMKARRCVVRGSAFVQKTSTGWHLSNAEGIRTNLAAWVLDIGFQPTDQYE